MYAKYIIEYYTYFVTHNITHLTYIKIYRIKLNLHSVFMVIILHTKSVDSVYYLYYLICIKFFIFEKKLTFFIIYIFLHTTCRTYDISILNNVFHQSNYIFVWYLINRKLNISNYLSFLQLIALFQYANP